MRDATITPAPMPATISAEASRPAPKPEPTPRRQAAGPVSTITRTISAWGERAADWIHQRTQAASRGDAVVYEFAAILREARGPDEVQLALARLAQRVSGASRVELYRYEGPNAAPRRVACWPDRNDADGAGRPAPPTEPDLRLPLILGDQTWGLVHLWAGDGASRTAHWPARMMRRLSALGTMAAAAERALRARRGAGLTTPLDPSTGLYNEPFLAALLAHSLEQAVRRREPLTLLYVGVDPPWTHQPAGQDGPEIADAIVQRVAGAIVGTIRASDVVGRLDDGQIAIVLPSAGLADAPGVAEIVRQAIAEAGLTAATALPLTVSVGIASYPEHAQTPSALRSAASAALSGAQSGGGNRVEIAPAPAARPAMRIAPCA